MIRYFANLGDFGGAGRDVSVHPGHPADEVAQEFGHCQN